MENQDMILKFQIKHFIGIYPKNTKKHEQQFLNIQQEFIIPRTIQPSEDDGLDAKFSTQDLPAGIYIIEQGTQTYKIRKK